MLLVCAALGCLLLLAHTRALSPRTHTHDTHTFRHAYSLWLQPVRGSSLYTALQREITRLGREYNGTSHPPHCTLYGAVYTSDETHVLSVAGNIAKQLRPFQLAFSHLNLKKHNPDKRWPGGLTMYYVQTGEVVNATVLAMRAYGATDQQTAHTTLLYDFDGRSSRDPSLVNATRLALHPFAEPSMHWLADELSVWRTPLRDRWSSSTDMQQVVGAWTRVASFALGGK